MSDPRLSKACRSEDTVTSGRKFCTSIGTHKQQIDDGSGEGICVDTYEVQPTRYVGEILDGSDGVRYEYDQALVSKRDCGGAVLDWA